MPDENKTPQVKPESTEAQASSVPASVGPTDTDNQISKIQEAKKTRGYKEAQSFYKRGIVKTNTRWTDFAVPLVSIVLFFGILAFLVYPNFNRIGENRSQVEKLNLELSAKQAEINQLKEAFANDEENKEILTKLEELIPTADTEVVAFQKKVEELAKDNFIELTEVRTGERLIVETDDETNQASSLSLRQIPVNFELKGKLIDFREVLSLLYNSNDFIVVTSMTLDLSEDEQDTEVELVLSKYQFDEFDSEQEQEQLLSKISYKEEPDSSVIEFVRRKSEATRFVFEDIN